jgi:nucleotide-binding universal stress UspA family protein
MSLNDIIVHVDSAEATKARVEFAVALAKDHGAHLLGIAFAPTTLLLLYGADVGLADMSEVFESAKTQSEAVLKSFKARAEAEGISVEVRLMQGMSEEFPRDFACLARHVDLAVIGQPHNGDPLIGQYALVERSLFASGRPIIIVPRAGGKLTFGGTLVVAWDGSAEAARALKDALVFLKRPKRIVLLVGAPEGAGEPPEVDDVLAHLKRRGMAAEVVRFSAGAGDIGKTILAKAKELNADMIVMGAFHHSRWREFILGGVTLTMLEEATIPLFMAH